MFWCNLCGQHHDGSTTGCPVPLPQPVQPVQPFKCPVCDGSTKVSRPPHVAGDQDTWMSGSPGELYDCAACDASGVIWGPPGAVGN